jgi:hypothetical protein
MDENDLDLAATMMEALRVGHNRHRPCFGGGGDGDSNGSLLLDSDTIGVTSSTSSSSSESAATRGGIANFGSVIHQPSGFEDYVYDDPLGHVRTFENGDSIDDEVNGTSKQHNSGEDDDGFMSVSKDGDVTRQHCSSSSSNRRIKHTRSNGSSDDEDDDDVPVLDLFTGTFDPDFANFDAFDDVAADNCVGIDLFDSTEDHRATQTVDSFMFSTTPLDLVDSLSE